MEFPIVDLSGQTMRQVGDYSWSVMETALVRLDETVWVCPQEIASLGWTGSQTRIVYRHNGHTTLVSMSPDEVVERIVKGIEQGRRERT